MQVLSIDDNVERIMSALAIVVMYNTFNKSTVQDVRYGKDKNPFKINLKWLLYRSNKIVMVLKMFFVEIR